MPQADVIIGTFRRMSEDEHRIYPIWVWPVLVAVAVALIVVNATRGNDLGVLVGGVLVVVGLVRLVRNEKARRQPTWSPGTDKP